jgi:hypothetical protein
MSSPLIAFQYRTTGHHARIGAGPANQALAGRLAEGQPKLDARHGGNQCLMNILHRLDEVRLAQNEVGIIGLFDLHDEKLHGSSPNLVGPRR